MRARFGKAAKGRRKTLTVPKGKIPPDADLVVTVSHKEGIGFYLSDEQRWAVSYPQQHHDRGTKKGKATSNRFMRTVRMFKAARNRLVKKRVISKGDAPSYFIECLLYNAPNGLFNPDLAQAYNGILDRQRTAKLKCQDWQVDLFGPGREQWAVKKAKAFVREIQGLWEMRD